MKKIHKKKVSLNKKFTPSLKISNTMNLGCTTYKQIIMIKMQKLLNNGFTKQM